MRNAILIILLAAVAAFAMFKLLAKNGLNPLHHNVVVAQAQVLTGIALADPEQAPSDIRNRVERGYRLMMDTPRYAPRYAGDQLSCTNCHFAEGDTVGGKNNGISLVGVTAQYPGYSARYGRVITLAERIGDCFERSLNGTRPPDHAPEVQDIIHYLEWISKEVKHAKQMPWLGVSPIRSVHRPNPENGAKNYQIYCAMCHKQDGEGGGVIDAIQGKTAPPLWGPHSFNDAAGMSTLKKLAAFIYWNMPYMDASLTEEQALDVAAFVLQQPRPHFEPKERIP